MSSTTKLEIGMNREIGWLEKRGSWIKNCVEETVASTCKAGLN